MSALRILFVGELVAASRSLQRVAALREEGHEVELMSSAPERATYEDRPSLYARIRYRLRIPADRTEINRRLVEKVEKRTFDADILWIERVLELRAATLRRIRNAYPETGFIWYAEDDMMNPRHRSRYIERAIPQFDVWVTTKSFNAAPQEVPSLGAKKVLFVDNAFDPQIHHPVALTPEDRARYGADVSFVGTFETPRAQSLLALAQRGYGVRVWGNGWRRMSGAHADLRIENRPVYGDDYAKVVAASRINLCFLRKSNRDLQTCRSMEIPAIGGFMLHERNGEITRIFAENEEAAYFDDDAELAMQCAKWLADEPGRASIAAAGHAAVTKRGFTHRDRVVQILDAWSAVKRGKRTP